MEDTGPFGSYRDTHADAHGSWSASELRSKSPSPRTAACPPRRGGLDGLLVEPRMRPCGGGSSSNRSPRHAGPEPTAPRWERRWLRRRHGVEVDPSETTNTGLTGCCTLLSALSVRSQWGRGRSSSRPRGALGELRAEVEGTGPRHDAAGRACFDRGLFIPIATLSNLHRQWFGGRKGDSHPLFTVTTPSKVSRKRHREYLLTSVGHAQTEGDPCSAASAPRSAVTRRTMSRNPTHRRKKPAKVLRPLANSPKPVPFGWRIRELVGRRGAESPRGPSADVAAQRIGRNDPPGPEQLDRNPASGRAACLVLFPCAGAKFPGCYQ